MLWLGLRPSSKQEGGDEVAGGWCRKQKQMSRSVDGEWISKQGTNRMGGWINKVE